MKRRPHSDPLGNEHPAQFSAQSNDLYGALSSDKHDALTLGRRAAELREMLGRTVEEVADQIGVSPSDLHRFEQTGEAPVQLLVGLLETLTPGGYLDHAFETPRFTSIREVVAFEQRRASRK